MVSKFVFLAILVIVCVNGDIFRDLRDKLPEELQKLIDQYDDKPKAELKVKIAEEYPGFAMAADEARQAFLTKMEGFAMAADEARQAFLTKMEDLNDLGKQAAVIAKDDKISANEEHKKLNELMAEFEKKEDGKAQVEVFKAALKEAWADFAPKVNDLLKKDKAN
uniref:Uncharacterized protein n=1 Tax=Panagrolaimus sp. JU765 TaxID=591449 RepID=A0AC34Q348_9BILA